MIIVKRKKAFAIFIIILTIPAYLMFIWVGFIGLLSDNGLFIKIYALFILGLMFFGVKAIYFNTIKIFNSNPEFELHADHLIAFDHPRYSKIPYSEVLECKIYYPFKGGPILGLTLKNESLIRGKINRIQRKKFKIPEDNKNIALFSLDFADIKTEVLQKTISDLVIEYKTSNRL